jgi:hypothetical protein
MSSLIYKNIRIYRSVMQLLYKGKYYRRFDPVKQMLDQINPDSILELCFGDLVIARYCREKNCKWYGIDKNESFIEYAIDEGFAVEKKNIDVNTKLMRTDVILMMGSLYHFHENAAELIKNMMNSANRILLSEPVKNLTSNRLYGKIAGNFSDSGAGSENFRYTRKSLTELAANICADSLFSYKIVYEGEKDLILLFERK